MRTLQALFFRDFYNDHVVEIFKEIFFERLYDSYIKPGDVVVDIGANQGYFTFWAHLKGAKTIISVEPSFEHYDTLQNMIIFNHLEHVSIVNAAISNFDGDGEFYHNENTTMYSLRSVVGQPNLGTENVKVMTIKSLLGHEAVAGKDIDLLKIDVEGSEFDILTSPEFTEVAPRVKKIIVEWHTWTGTQPGQLIALLSDLGFYVKQLQTQATVFLGERK